MFENGEVLVQKFGGSSMASPERIKKAAERIAAKAHRKNRMVIVVSAMGDTTDSLISLMGKISPSPARRELDCLMATGEMVSASLMTEALSRLGVKAASFNAFNLGLISEYQKTDYNIVKIAHKNRLAEFLKPGCAAVVAGFQGITENGDLTTLGRGGSDLTAVFLARELGQKVCEKYTDEDGIYTADPRIVSDAKKVWQLTYDEMLALALFGNGILHPRAIETAKQNDIRIHVRSSFSSSEGSIVGPNGDEQIPVKSITQSDKFVYTFIYGIKKPDEAFFKDMREFNFKPVITAYKPKLKCFALGFNRADAFCAIPFCWQEAAKLNADKVDTFASLSTITLSGCGLKNEACAKQFINLPFVKPLVCGHRAERLSFAVEKNRSEELLRLLHGKITRGRT